MDNTIRNALRKRQNLVLELEAVDKFLKTYESFSGTKIPKDEMTAPNAEPDIISDLFGSRPNVTKRRNNVTHIVGMLEKFLMEDGPLNRNELVAKFEKADYTIHSKHIPTYISNLLFLNKDRFVNTNNGYIIRVDDET